MTPHASTIRASRGARGLTTLEMLLAIAITAIVGLAIATVMTAVSRGMSSAGQARSALQRVHAAHVRLRAYTDAAMCVLQYDENQGFALWLADDRPNNQVNLSELRVFWFVPDQGKIRVERVKWPDDWTTEQIDAADIALASTDDFFTEMSDQRTLGYTETGTIVDGISDYGLAFNGATIPESERVRMSVWLPTDQDEDSEVLLVFGLPNHRMPE